MTFAKRMEEAQTEEMTGYKMNKIADCIAICNDKLDRTKSPTLRRIIEMQIAELKQDGINLLQSQGVQV